MLNIQLASVPVDESSPNQSGKGVSIAPTVRLKWTEPKNQLTSSAVSRAENNISHRTRHLDPAACARKSRVDIYPDTPVRELAIYVSEPNEATISSCRTPRIKTKNETTYGTIRCVLIYAQI